MTALKLPCPGLSVYPIQITWQSTRKTWSHSTRWNPPTSPRVVNDAIIPAQL